MGLNLRIRPSASLIVLVLIFLVMPAGRIFGQATGSVTGTVMDTTGALVPGATVTLINGAT